MTLKSIIPYIMSLCKDGIETNELSHPVVYQKQGRVFEASNVQGKQGKMCVNNIIEIKIYYKYHNPLYFLEN